MSQRRKNINCPPPLTETMRKIFFPALVFITNFISAQNIEDRYRNLSILEKELAAAKTPAEKTSSLISLYLYHAYHNDSENIKSAPEYLNKLEIFVNETKNSELIR